MYPFLKYSENIQYNEYNYKDKHLLNVKRDEINVPGVQIPPTEFRLGDPTYASPKMPSSNFKSVKRCARQKSL